MSVGKICIRDVDLADTGETVQVAAARMHARKVGTLVVLDRDKVPIGIVTDRDLAVRVVAEGRDPYQTTVGDVMSTCPRSVKEDLPIEAALTVMRSGPYRRIPVVDSAGKLAGLVSLDDVLDLLAEEFSQVGALLKQESPQSLGKW
jgi:CBS domain-containing protein